MSLGTRGPWQQAFDVAKHLSADLEPVTARAKAVGSLRRRRPTVSDIEFLVEPRIVATDLFGGQQPDVQVLHDLAHEWGRVTKKGPKQVQIREVGGTDLTAELYIVTPPASWWCLMVIRTGPAELGKLGVTLMRERGFIHRDGRIVRRDGSEHPEESEEEWFRCAGLPYYPPHLRDDRAALRPLTEEA